MNTAINGITATRLCISLGLLLLALTSHDARGSEMTTASGHICSGCPACDQSADPLPKANEHRCIDHLHRTGHPETLGRFAKPSLNQHFSFGYVGGGATFRGEPRVADEGTWGVDYSGILLKKRIWLQWLHGHREPRGEGSYEPDGPHLLGH